MIIRYQDDNTTSTYSYFFKKNGLVIFHDIIKGTTILTQVLINYKNKGKSATFSSYF